MQVFRRNTLHSDEYFCLLTYLLTSNPKSLLCHLQNQNTSNFHHIETPLLWHCWYVNHSSWSIIETKWWLPREIDYIYFTNKIGKKRNGRHTGWWPLELMSNSRMWGFPAAAKYFLFGVISSRLTFCIFKITIRLHECNYLKAQIP